MAGLSKQYDIVVFGNYTKDTIITSAGTRYVDVNTRLEEIPPGLVDHREWTPENGRNNALRINGLGAPRAFNTALLRQVRLPNVTLVSSAQDSE